MGGIHQTWCLSDPPVYPPLFYFLFHDRNSEKQLILQNGKRKKGETTSVWLLLFGKQKHVSRVCMSVCTFITFSGAFLRNGIKFGKTYPRPTSVPMGIFVILCVRPSVQLSVSLSFGIADKSLGRKRLHFGMLLYPDDLPSVYRRLWSLLSVLPPHFQVFMHLPANHLEEMA